MIPAILINFINLFVLVFNFLLLARVIWSWINPMPTGGIGGLLFDLTEPILAPVRRLLPGSNMGIDFSPLVVFFLLQIIAQVINGAVY